MIARGRGTVGGGSVGSGRPAGAGAKARAAAMALIGAGALVLDRVLRRTGVDSMVASEADILDGIAWSLVS